MATVAVLVGLVVGTLVAWALGDAHFSAVGESSWVGVTTPFYFGWPQFSIAAIISMVVVMLITAVETTGDVFATAEIVDKKVGKDDIARALRADGLSTTLGGVLNSFPYTCFAENVGLVRLTRIKSRYVVAAAGLFMIILGLIPKAGAIVAGIPHPVLGGAALAMFATVAVVGIQTLSKVDFNDHRNIVIVGTSLGLALLVTAQPDIAKAVPPWAQIILGSGITLGSLTAILLNVVFHHVGKSRGPAVAGTPGHGDIRLSQVNDMSEDEFVRAFGKIFQGPPWAVENAYAQRPFSDTHALRTAFQDALFGATPEQQRDLMTHYPALGSEAVAEGKAGEMSVRDQETLGLDPARRRGPRGVPGADLGVRVEVRLPADRLCPGRARPQPAPAAGADPAAQLAHPGARRCADRDREDRRPSLRRPGGRRQPDPHRSHPALREPAQLMHRRPAQEAQPARGLDRLNALPEAEAQRVLLDCCSSLRWAQRLAADRPYGSPAELYEAADHALDALTDADLDDALDGHPRIGERRDGDATSAREQSAVGRADTATQRAIAAGNERYEERFGQVYLVAAAGRSAEDLLDDLNRRLGNDRETERAVLRRELATINRSRLARLVGEEP